MNPPLHRLRARARLPSPPDNPLLTRHQAFIRALPCVSCGKPAPSECAQVRMHAGLGLPPSDRYLVPLCGPATVWQDCCHSRKHYRGAARFWSELGIDPLDLAARLWRVSGDVTAGRCAVMRARQAVSRQRRIRRDGKGSSSRCALDRGAALRDRLRPTALVIPPMSSELPLLVESRS
jgi:hypothetical protein